MSSHWKLTDVVLDHHGQHREVATVPSAFFQRILDELLPSGSIVLRSGSEFALDLVEHGERYPMTEPMPWHEFVAELQPAQVA